MIYLRLERNVVTEIQNSLPTDLQPVADVTWLELVDTMRSAVQIAYVYDPVKNVFYPPNDIHART